MTEENVVKKGSQSSSESVNNFDVMVASLEDSVLTELQPLAPNMPQEVGLDDVEQNNMDSEDSLATDYVQVQYTKKGTVRKSKKFVIPLNARKKQKFDAEVRKNCVKAGCTNNCRRKSTLKISEERRLHLNLEF